MTDTKPTNTGTFDIGGTTDVKNTNGGLVKLADIQKGFKQNLQNATLNLARLEQCGAFPAGCALLVTTSGVYVTRIPKSELLEMADDAQLLPIGIPGGDRRNTKYHIDA